MAGSPSRRDVLAASGGLLAGVAAGYVARPYVANESAPEPVPLAWADTEWPFSDYDAAHTRSPPVESAPGGDIAVEWEEPTPRARPPTVVVSNGHVVAGAPDSDDSHVVALDANSGDGEWWTPASGSLETPVAALGDSVFSFGEGGSGLRSQAAATGDLRWRSDSPRQPLCIGGGRLFVVDRRDGGGIVRAVHARTGDDLWSAPTDGRVSDPVAYDDDTDRVFGQMDGRVFAIDPTDGSVVWREDVGGNSFTHGPVVADGRVFRAAFQSGLAALDAADGDVLWREPFDPELAAEDDPEVARWFDVGAAKDDTVVAVERHGDETSEQLAVFDAASGDRQWATSFTGEASVSKPTVVDGSAYACVGGDETQKLVRFDLADGSRTGEWSLPTYGGPPAIADGWVFVPTYDGLLAFR